ncbi:MAG: ATP-binding cassette domain-containing protein, partial [Planctomycetia bacterium]|nr:ATP-binding cassette domain-containing protein [Planctomycetia bacterium]
MSNVKEFKVQSSKFKVNKPAPTLNFEPGTLNLSAALLSARGLVKSYRKTKVVVPVLKGVDFSVREGGFVAVVGQSGCGKSTLLHLLGTLDAPDAGEIYFEGRRIDHLAPRNRDALRNE